MRNCVAIVFQFWREEASRGVVGSQRMSGRFELSLPKPHRPQLASIDVPEPVPEKKARDGSESGSDIEDVPEDKPLYLLPENQHHPPEFLTGAAPQRFPVHIAGT